MTPEERVKLLINKLSITQKKFATNLGISPARLNNYLSGVSQVPRDMLLKIANNAGCSVSWLLTGEGEMFKQLDIPISPTPKSFHLPVIEDIAAGSPIDVTDFEPDHFIDIPGTVLLLPPPYYAFQVSGNSMEPEIFASDIVIVSGSWYDISLDDRICAFRTGEGIILKRLELNHKSKFGKLYSINYRAHKPIKYDRDTEDLTLIGVLCLLVRNYLREEK